jgi:hypothetical protein
MSDKIYFLFSWFDWRNQIRISGEKRFSIYCKQFVEIIETISLSALWLKRSINIGWNIRRITDSDIPSNDKL